MKIGRLLCYLFLMTVASVALLLPASVLAQEETIELKTTYPRVESTADGAIFEFPISLIYRGSQAREFDLLTSGPSDWDIYVTSSDESIRISVIRLEPSKYPPEQVKVSAIPSPSVIPEFGDYKITLVAVSGDIRHSIKLTAVVIPTYSLGLNLTWRYNRKATANRENWSSLVVTNTGNGELTNIRLSAGKPQDWIVEFQPETIDRLAPGISQEIQVNIKPPANTADRDYRYRVTLTAETSQTRQTTIEDIRVEEPRDFWMWIGGAIALVAIGAFTFIFLRFGRNK